MHDPYSKDFSAVNEGPPASHLLGTDDIGGDVLARLLVGCRLSLTSACPQHWWRWSRAVCWAGRR